jgi:hypothetical protein
MGGLGNQMFQYSAARRLAYRRGVDIGLDCHRLEEVSPTGTRRDYMLDVFQLPEGVTRSPAKPGVTRALLRRLNPFAGSVVYQERGYAFDPRVLDLRDGVCLDGYWQSELYFHDVADLIRRDFAFRSPPRGQNEKLLAEIDACPAISVHVRRGDYVNDPRTARFHGVPGPAYYREAMRIICDKVPGACFFVFSDEPEWCRENPPGPGDCRIVEGNPADTGWEDLRLMSRCRHHIIANSSFSWWGAWLNPRADKQVVAPRRWFADTEAPDVVPAAWIRL